MFEFDALARAIRAKIAPDVNTAMMHAEPITLRNPEAHSLTIPLQADVQVAYEKGMAAFVIRTKIFNTSKNDYFNQEAVFSTRNFAHAHDKAGALTMIFEQAKHRMLQALAERELDWLISENEGRTS